MDPLGIDSKASWGPNSKIVVYMDPLGIDSKASVTRKGTSSFRSGPAEHFLDCHRYGLQPGADGLLLRNLI